MKPAKTIKEVLTAVLWMYQNGLTWCQYSASRDKEGNPITIRSSSKDVYQACLAGALGLVECNIQLRQRTSLHLAELIDIENCGNLIGWNDERGRTQEQVFDLLKRGIESA